MGNKRPWEDKWLVKENLSQGGQGTTWLVTSNTKREEGVLKLLHDQENKLARARFKREVTNLEVLSEYSNVPKVLDHNMGDYDDTSKDLFLVMEYIKGETLESFVNEKGGLSVELSIELAIKLAHIVKVAISNEILHRDIKPKNLIISDKSESEIFVVDYGLSFNSRINDDLTRVDETIDNSFLSLPEGRAPGSNKRDFRSDITCVAAIFYYCLTGNSPGVLVGPNGESTHRIEGRSVKEKMGGSKKINRIESFLDKAFSGNINNRFQSIEDLIDRIEIIKNTDENDTSIDIVETAIRVAGNIKANDRKTQLDGYRSNWRSLPNIVSNTVNQYKKVLEENGFNIQVSHGPSDNFLKNKTLDQSLESLNLNYSSVKVNSFVHPEISYSIIYLILVKSNECVIHKIINISKTPNNNGNVIPTHIIGDAEMAPKDELVKEFIEEIKQDLNRGLEWLGENI